MTKNVICSECDGTREKKGSQSIQCYSCRGEGVRIDPYNGKKSPCNACGGFGKVV